jgi:DNA-binding transcriptional regulator YiaG
MIHKTTRSKKNLVLPIPTEAQRIIEELKKKHGMTTQAIAAEIGAGLQTVYRWSWGTHAPQPTMRYKLQTLIKKARG